MQLVTLKALANRLIAYQSLSADLEGRIRAMAERWSYSADDLAESLQLARANPIAWARAVERDEQREQEFRERGLLRVDA
jgi:hypothetical protein